MKLAFFALSTLLVLHHAHAQFGRGCADLGDALINEACSGFVQYVKDSNEYYYDKPNSALQQYIRQTPSPSAQCCSDATAFVNKGCSCNSMFVSYVAAQRGFTAKTLAVVARAVQLSSCAANSPINNPCDSGVPAAQTPRLITVDG
ncbi:hypothetical protein COCSUDRAFT_49193 [Coccomyxa subellipsoidea C-169]|uniref:Bifunctional inhibitor/plant lipid transfer protein/seed storage helical domain-containing protein n=1 Tax=Coccomyxa subellipsoidea (strain C-169) TaxID=574566 RepID=I0YK46_COCSC|nr:hypothetical protein COCSUDRAFT_49193 [Coccomyxa subellipsoidea C-169]EIE18765.1 hypothetical protein COCSUDRAFT_49193 [Coccomyxa subellipsoidea C-169]|eukprot:XP_005643309.1 hypothetical protein COCSUDRAFT_49193 [Coccomyxa subellipsoidea C-169]